MHTGIVTVILGGLIALMIGVAMPGWAYALIVLWGLMFAVLNYNSPADRQRILAVIQQRDNLYVYSALINWMSVILARLISPALETDTPKPPSGQGRFVWYMTPRAQDNETATTLLKNPWSWPILNLALKLAVIYPLLFMLLQWGWTGDETGLAGAPLIEAEGRIWPRTVLISLIVMLLLYRIVASARQHGVFKMPADGLFWVVVGVAVAFAAPSAFAVPVAFAGAGIFAVPVVVVFATAVAVPIAGAFAFAFAALVVGALTCAVAFAGAALTGYLVNQGRATLGYGLLIISALFATSATLVLADLPDNFRLLFFALSALPLINAVFDYLSYGLTLALINTGQKDDNNHLIPLLWLIDIIVALLILITLGTTLGLYVTLINALAGVPHFDVAAIIAGLHNPDTRGEFTWLYLSMLTTLVPTLVHTVLMLLSGFTWLPQRLKKWIAHLIQSGETDDLGTLVGTALAASIGTACIGAIIAALYWISHWLRVDFEHFGLWLLRVVETLLSHATSLLALA